MGVIKLSKSGKVVMFIDDTGVVHYTSTTFVRNLLAPNSQYTKFPITLRRFKEVIKNARFPKSEVYEIDSSSITTNKAVEGLDPLGAEVNTVKADIAAYEDKNVW